MLWPVSQNFYDHLQILSVFSNAFSPINEDKEVSVWLPAYHSLQAMLVWERLSSRKRPEMKIGNLRSELFRRSQRDKSEIVYQDMRDLYRQRLSRVVSSRIWTCSGCQQHRIRQFTMSNSPRQHEENFPGPLKQNAPLDDAAADGEGETMTNKRQEPKRTHLKNSGQYFVTTPIFYVNGGNLHSFLSDRRSTCRTYAFNGTSRCA